MGTIKNIYSIQVFNSVAQLKNAAAAAQDLNMSQSSVSYHIKKLEDEAGVKLFNRTAGGLTLSGRGVVLASHVAEGLASIQAGLDKISGKPDEIRIAVPPMFASRWLSPRLGDLWEAYPDLQMSFHKHHNTYATMEAPETHADIGIQWGRGGWGGFESTRLWDEEMVAVCSPDYLERNPIECEADMQRQILIHVDDETMWQEWFDNAGLTMPSMPALPAQALLEDRHFQLSSTINGGGVSLFAERLVIGELKSGALLNPLGKTYPTVFGYYVVEPKKAQKTKASRLIRDWLLQLNSS